MVINDLVEVVANKARLTKKDALTSINTIFATLAEALSTGEDVKISGFGTFAIRETKERVGINPATKEKISIPASKKLVFKPSKTLKTLVKESSDEQDEDEK